VLHILTNKLHHSHIANKTGQPDHILPIQYFLIPKKRPLMESLYIFLCLWYPERTKAATIDSKLWPYPGFYSWEWSGRKGNIAGFGIRNPVTFIIFSSSNLIISIKIHIKKAYSYGFTVNNLTEW